MTAASPDNTLRHPSASDTASQTPVTPPLLPLILLTALSVVPVNMILPSLPHIAAEFHASSAVVSLSVAGYAVVTALIEIVSGAISDRYGRRPVALTAIVVFISASIGCAVSTDIVAFMIFRALQASIAACFSIALVIIKETSGGHATASRFGYLAMGWALAPMLAPVVGGSLDAAFGWRAIFITLATAGTAVLILSLVTLPETADRARRSHSSAGAYLRLIRSSAFWCYALCMAASMGTLYLFLAGAPVALGPLLGGSTAKLGLSMGIVPAGFMLGSLLAGRYASRMSLGTVLVTARTLTCTGLLLGLGHALMDAGNAFALFGPCMFIGIGNGLTMPAANSGVLSAHPDHAGTAAGLAAALSIGGGALIVSLGGPFIAGASAIPLFFAVMLVPAGMALLAAICAAFLGARVE
ncbi:MULTISPECIES: MFS transporter [unclassified Rhizobium]|uniref:MFS transporter n=1 Tax=unclassified Rhizobium TaxID=2613769 RepID=UPI001ADC95C9|nr:MULTISPECIES: MFS transporter [unclassified Rhizobium]MBO9099925.1 MFS transporter [Rhizobium sp. L58/93]MBO9135863.1 MFS transporter [Rhizobium sp. B209b/85]MBO9169914.1 MFS transporter [Rhizobium sp. L245/93]MBO9185872.1 MFS transporter [Rhizobium sp. E27B/91]QXZ82741.1 MFS transporter [Rhizobium sp. K1/93]